MGGASICQSSYEQNFGITDYAQDYKTNISISNKFFQYTYTSVALQYSVDLIKQPFKPFLCIANTKFLKLPTV